MKGYMEFIEDEFQEACNWDIHRSYANVTLNSEHLLDFKVPSGATLTLSSQASPVSYTSYSLSNLGILNGSIAYVYSSRHLPPNSSRSISLAKIMDTYRSINTSPVTKVDERAQSPSVAAPERDIRNPIASLKTVLPGEDSADAPKDDNPLQQPVAGTPAVTKTGTLLYGRIQFPGNVTEAMVAKQWSPVSKVVAKWVCDDRLPHPVIMTATLYSGNAKWMREYIYSTHDNLLGFRALGIIATYPREEGDSRPPSQLSSGAEIFYAISKKVPGASVAARYTTYARYTQTQATMSIVCNPLMGSINATYAIKPTEQSAFASRYDFNFYSYLSDLTIGAELWRNDPISSQAASSKIRPGPRSVLKASTSLASQTLNLLWGGGYHDFLISLGGGFCYGDRAIPFQYGIELAYSS